MRGDFVYRFVVAQVQAIVMHLPLVLAPGGFSAEELGIEPGGSPEERLDVGESVAGILHREIGAGHLGGRGLVEKRLDDIAVLVVAEGYGNVKTVKPFEPAQMHHIDLSQILDALDDVLEVDGRAGNK